MWIRSVLWFCCRSLLMKSPTAGQGTWWPIGTGSISGQSGYANHAWICRSEYAKVASFGCNDRTVFSSTLNCFISERLKRSCFLWHDSFNFFNKWTFLCRLNEGHTVYIERMIARCMESEQLRQFEGIGGWKELQESVRHTYISHLTVIWSSQENTGHYSQILVNHANNVNYFSVCLVIFCLDFLMQFTGKASHCCIVL